nr:phosphoribosyltransferase family protein [uncultured Sphaerochaeta sp.]
MMETLTTVLGWLGYAFAIIGFIGTVWKTINIWMSQKTFSWKDFDRQVKSIIRQMRKDGFYPDIIVSIGRGGAIVGATISGNLHHCERKAPKDSENITILGCDRVYEWKNGQRIEVGNAMVDFSPITGKKVLVVASDVMTGGTMKRFLEQLREVNPSVIRTSCLVKGVTASFSPDYVGKVIPGDFKMPWMYKGYGYVRDSRKPQHN